MLKGIHPLLPPDLLHVLSAMGHGDERVERFVFYMRARQAFAVVATSEARPYGCVVFTKGVVS